MPQFFTGNTVDEEKQFKESKETTDEVKVLVLHNTDRDQLYAIKYNGNIYHVKGFSFSLSFYDNHPLMRSWSRGTAVKEDATGVMTIQALKDTEIVVTLSNYGMLEEDQEPLRDANFSIREK